MTRKKSLMVFVVGALIALGVSIYGEASNIQKTAGKKRSDQTQSQSDAGGQATSGSTSDTSNSNMGYGSSGSSMGY